MEQYKIDLIRRFLEEKYGVEYKKNSKRRRLVGGMKKGKHMPGKLSKPSGCLPMENRNNPTLPFPQLSEEDISMGLMNLLERGLIPQSCDLTTVISTYPSPVTTHPMKYHHPMEKRALNRQIYTSEFGNNLYNVKYDLVSEIEKKYRKEYEQRKIALLKQKRLNVVNIGGSLPRKKKKKRNMTKQNGYFGNERTKKYDELMDTYSHHHVIIRRGKVLYDTEEFISYQRKYRIEWGSIVSLLREIEYLMKKHSVPLAFVDGKKLFELSEICMEQPTQKQLLECLVNYDEVSPLILAIEERFQGEEGRHKAAIVIQKTWRMYAAIRRYKVLVIRERNAKKIQLQWTLRKRFFETREKVNMILEKSEIEWNMKMKVFKDEWTITKEQPLLVIHLPSLSYRSIDKRKTIPQFSVKQNSQLARLIIDLKNPKTEVIYISPFPVGENEEGVDYVINILVSQGFDKSKLMKRFKIIYPEHTNVFPKYLSLSRYLLYSPRTMKFLETRCSGRNCVLVPGHTSKEDHRIAVKLGIPLYGSNPLKSEDLQTKGGCKSIFKLASVNIPSGSFEPLYSKTNLILQLSNNIIDSPSYRRWIIKINNEREGRGFAVLDISKLYCLAKSEREKLHKELKSKRLDHELLDHLRDRLYFELREKFTDILHIVSSHVYKDCKKFMEAVEKFGAITEAYPNRIVGSPVVNILIEPNGVIKIQSIQDKVSYRGILTSCYLYPQKMVPEEALISASLVVGGVLYKKDILGYVSIEYIAFLNSKKQLKLWGIDLDFRLTEHALFHSVFETVTNTGGNSGKKKFGMDLKDGEFPPIYKNANNETQTQYSYLFTGIMRHPSFALWRHGNFFSRLRKKGLLFHLHEKRGIVFQIPHNIVKGCIGVLCIAQDKKNAVNLLSKFISFIQEQCDEDLVNSSLTLSRHSNLAKIIGGMNFLLAQL